MDPKYIEIKRKETREAVTIGYDVHKVGTCYNVKDKQRILPQLLASSLDSRVDSYSNSLPHSPIVERW